MLGKRAIGTQAIAVTGSFRDTTLASSFAIISAITGTLNGSRPIGSTLTAVSALTAPLSGSRTISGDVDILTTIAPILGRNRGIDSTLNIITLMPATPAAVTRAGIATITGTVTVSGSVIVGRLAGSAVAITTALVPTAKVARPASSTLSTTTEITGRIVFDDAPLCAVLTLYPELSGQITIGTELMGVISTHEIKVAATLEVEGELSGVVSVFPELAGTITMEDC